MLKCPVCGKNCRVYEKDNEYAIICYNEKEHPEKDNPYAIFVERKVMNVDICKFQTNVFPTIEQAIEHYKVLKEMC